MTLSEVQMGERISAELSEKWGPEASRGARPPRYMYMTSRARGLGPRVACNERPGRTGGEEGRNTLRKEEGRGRKGGRKEGEEGRKEGIT